MQTTDLKNKLALYLEDNLRVHYKAFKLARMIDDHAETFVQNSSIEGFRADLSVVEDNLDEAIELLNKTFKKLGVQNEQEED